MTSWDDLAKLTASIETKVEVIREGASLRTSAELLECFIDDACGLLDVNRQQLTNYDESDEDFDETEAFASDAREYEEKLNAAGYDVVWNDGYVIYKDLTDEEAEFAHSC